MRELRGELVASLRLLVGAVVLMGLLLWRAPHVLTSLGSKAGSWSRAS